MPLILAVKGETVCGIADPTTPGFTFSTGGTQSENIVGDYVHGFSSGIVEETETLYGCEKGETWTPETRHLLSSYEVPDQAGANLTDQKTLLADLAAARDVAPALTDAGRDSLAALVLPMIARLQRKFIDSHGKDEDIESDADVLEKVLKTL